MTVETMPLDAHAATDALLINAIYAELQRQGLPTTVTNLYRTLQAINGKKKVSNYVRRQWRRISRAT